jgi:hypothetical protein
VDVDGESWRAFAGDAPGTFLETLLGIRPEVAYGIQCPGLLTDDGRVEHFRFRVRHEGHRYTRGMGTRPQCDDEDGAFH